MRVKFTRFLVSFCGFAICLAAGVSPAQSPSELGVFEGQTDVGQVAPPGRAMFDVAHRLYKVDAAGANMWSTVDGFHFVWKRVSGDVSVTAEMAFPSTSGNPDP